VIGRLHHVILDCPDPRALARFYSELLGLPISYDSGDFVVVSLHQQASGLAFQLAPDHQPPLWGDPTRPQQIHLDVMVDDLAAAHTAVLGLGAVRIGSPDGDVYTDPAGHTFCLINRPGWAEPVNAG
jgi:catechol 2,3-dioxygenase-like lactoylglutathione lyase family enzyme